MITPINQQLLKKLSMEAVALPRRRKNHNFHENSEACKKASKFFHFRHLFFQSKEKINKLKQYDNNLYW